MQVLNQSLKYMAVSLVFLAVLSLGLGVRWPGRGTWARWKQRLTAWYDRGLARVEQRTIRLGEAKRWRRWSAWGALGGVLTGFVMGEAHAGALASLLWGVLLAALGFMTPRWIRAWRIRERRRRMEAQLPDVLEWIAHSLRAGLSMIQALETVGNEGAAPIAHEFLEVVRDIRLGLSPEDALEKLNVRWQHADLELFVMAVNVAGRTGGDLAAVTEQIVGTIRERVRLKRRIATLTSQGVLSGWIVGLLPVGLLGAMYVLDPEMISGFVTHPVGMLMLGGGALMELLGVLMIRRIVAIDV